MKKREIEFDSDVYQYLRNADIPFTVCLKERKFVLVLQKIVFKSSGVYYVFMYKVPAIGRKYISTEDKSNEIVIYV